MKLKWTNFLLLTIAGIINSMGVCLFLAPSGLYDGGISGTSMLLDRLTPSVFTLSIFLLILNIPLFAYGLKKQGKEFTIYSLYAVCIYSLFSYIIKAYFLNDWTAHFEVMDLFLCAVFGGILPDGGVFAELPAWKVWGGAVLPDLSEAELWKDVRRSPM